MNRLICPSCQRPSYCASLRGPIHCAYDGCGALILPGEDVEVFEDRRQSPRVDPATEVTVEYLAEDQRHVEDGLTYVDVSVVGLSVILGNYPPLGSRVVVGIARSGSTDEPLRVQGIVREVRPAPEAGFRVGIEVVPGDSPENH